MKVLSLFDGISCAKVALERSGVPITSYTAYEIDKFALKISKKNHPTINHCGSVVDLKTPIEVDLLIGGSPCQDLSISAFKSERKGLEGERSGLFWEYVRIKELCRPKWFILENVASMSKDAKDTITKALGVEPILIDASLVSAQSRRRLFWTNIPNVKLPEDKKITLKDILVAEADPKYTSKLPYTETNADGRLIGHVSKKSRQGTRVYSIKGKSQCLASNGSATANTGLYKLGSTIRRLTPLECERLQSLPDNYTEGVSDCQRYKMIGNAFNVDVVAHIVANIPRV